MARRRYTRKSNIVDLRGVKVLNTRYTLTQMINIISEGCEYGVEPFSMDVEWGICESVMGSLLSNVWAENLSLSYDEIDERESELLARRMPRWFTDGGLSYLRLLAAKGEITLPRKYQQTAEEAE